jgi:hypothetical protein
VVKKGVVVQSGMHQQNIQQSYMAHLSGYFVPTVPELEYRVSPQVVHLIYVPDFFTRQITIAIFAGIDS